MRKKIENTTKKPSMLKLINFNEAYIPPVFLENKKNNELKFLSYGKDNLYDRYLLDLYNNSSPLHKGIINKKVKMISGFGYQDVNNPTFDEFLYKNKFERLLLHLTTSFEIFNSFAIEVVWNNGGNSFDLYYVPVTTLRIGLKDNEDEEDYFWYCKDWKNYKKQGYEPEYIKSFDPNDRTGRQILFYSDPGVLDEGSTYPLPTYSSGINYIEMDKEIGQFHLNQLKQGFFPSLFLNFVGVPTEEEQNDFYRGFLKQFQGSENSGKIIMNWSSGKDEEPTLTPINYNTSDDRFILLQELAEKNITQSHEVPIALVSSIPGKLGGSDERKELIAEFNTYYVKSRQNQIEEVLNGLFDTIGFEEIKLNDYVSDIRENEGSNVLTD